MNTKSEWWKKAVQENLGEKVMVEIGKNKTHTCIYAHVKLNTWLVCGISFKNTREKFWDIN